MQIDYIKNSSDNCRNFNGLTRMLSKSVYNSEPKINSLVSAYPKSDGFAGNLPKEIILTIEKYNKKSQVNDAIKNVKNSFANSSNNIRNAIYKTSQENIKHIFKTKLFDDFLLAQAQNDISKMKSYMLEAVLNYNF